jgi:hypothetical protein
VDSQTGIEVQVVDWNNGAREVAIHFKDFGQLLTLNANGARNLAFMLMECADFIEPPFNSKSDSTSVETDESADSVSIFGPYDDDVLDSEEEPEDHEDVDEEDDDEDEE